jgi:DNA/RNA-binding domain of Phe-tRNA-synthetase-like protein
MINYFKRNVEGNEVEIIIDSTLKEKVPDFKAGIIHYRGIEVGESPQMLKGRLQLFQESIYFDLQDQSVTDFPGISEWRDVFRKTGKDPNRYRHSAEALYRRIGKQNYLGTINSAIDLNNFFSLRYQVPVGVYDWNKVDGNSLTLRVGGPGESYKGLNGRDNSLEGLIIACDGSGPFGSPFVDSARAPVDEKTTEAVQIIYMRPSLSSDECDQLTSSLEEMFIGIHGGEATHTVVTTDY